MSTFLREKIFADRSAQVRAVPMPGWGATVYVRALSLAECGKLDAKNKGASDVDIILNLTTAAACDESGAPLFTEADRDALAGLRKDDVRRLYMEAARFNGYIDDPEGDAKKGSPPTPDAATSSGSPGDSAG